MAKKIRVTVWNEGRHEQTNKDVQRVYPKGIHNAIADLLKKDKSVQVRTATLDDKPDHGLTDKVLEATDVLTWWGHMAHHDVRDDVAYKVVSHVQRGMGLIVLHSGHMSKPFRYLLGTSGTLRWREIAERERLWNIEPSHPITKGIGDYIELPNTEMYGERFGIPTPDKLIFISWFEGGEVFRSGCCWERDHGRIFYFRPGHETYPIFYNKQVAKVLQNAVRWAVRDKRRALDCPNIPQPMENVPDRTGDFGIAGHFKGKKKG